MDECLGWGCVRNTYLFNTSTLPGDFLADCARHFCCICRTGCVWYLLSAIERDASPVPIESDSGSAVYLGKHTIVACESLPHMMHLIAWYYHRFSLPSNYTGCWKLNPRSTSDNCTGKVESGKISGWTVLHSTTSSHAALRNESERVVHNVFALQLHSARVCMFATCVCNANSRCTHCRWIS
eukprot:SAG31_NODE_1322_length_8786_cov_2.268576_3_plen_182_part_00